MIYIVQRRTPRGVRGLKFYRRIPRRSAARSHPSRGAWIEILLRRPIPGRPVSHPSRGAWIEMVLLRILSARPSVAPLAGCVD